MKSLCVAFLFFGFYMLVCGKKGDKDDVYRAMFYNVENFFDPFDDSLTLDDEFLPTSYRHWTWSRFNQKVNKLYKVIVRVGEWNHLSLIALCEVENSFVLKRLVRNTPLEKVGYKIVHRDSPDRRGIDVALLYDPLFFNLLGTDFFTVNMPSAPQFKTRDILYAKGTVGGKDTLHIFINHWPSRRGGELASMPKRKFLAAMLRQKIDSLMCNSPRAKILIMGDLNDEPANVSVLEGLRAKRQLEIEKASDLINLSWEYPRLGAIGTHKYQGKWAILDQVIISQALLEGPSLRVKQNSATIFCADFLLIPDTKYLGKKPKRTYTGFKYTGGYSDHLPVYVDFSFY